MEQGKGVEAKKSAPKKPPIQWSWAGDEGVKVGKTEYILKPEVTAEQMVTYLEVLELESEVFMGLVTARTAFSVGQATSYANAGNKLRDLIKSMKASESVLSDMSDQFSEFFSPSGLNVSFKGQNNEYSRMTRKLLIRLVDSRSKKDQKE